MPTFLQILLLSVLAFLLFRVYRKYRVARRRRLIDSYQFPARISTKLSDKYPHLSEPQVALVIDGLREYFHICNIAGRRMVAMPSQAVDVAWHEFILFTRHYKQFCEKALGRFLHHTPAEAMSSPTIAQQGIKRAWRIACRREQIKPDAPNRLPLLFALDADLAIPDGFRYALDCRRSGDAAYCAGHIGCGGGCGSCAGGCGGDASGCGSGCGGGCGGD